MRADDLLAACFPDQAACGENLTGTDPRIPDHARPRDDSTTACMKRWIIDGLHRRCWKASRAGAIRTSAIDTPEPSAFSHEILNANPYAYLDDAPLEERRTRAVQLRRTVRTDFVDGAGALDPDAIVQVAAESWPLVRDADELHEALLTLITVPPVPSGSHSSRRWWKRAVGRTSRSARVLQDPLSSGPPPNAPASHSPSTLAPP
jgi:ATP-dependent Lhr-like helicase